PRTTPPWCNGSRRRAWSSTPRPPSGGGAPRRPPSSGTETKTTPPRHPRLPCAADLLQNRNQQPPAHAPGHAEAARELGRAAVQAAVDVDLLVRHGAVAAVLGGGAAQRGFHGVEDLARELAAAGGIEGQGGP